MLFLSAINSFIAILSLSLCIVASIFVWIPTTRIDEKIYKYLRNTGAILLIFFAFISIFSFITGTFINQQGKFIFSQLSLSILLFWAIFPPVWFFIEYWAFESGTIEGYSEEKKEKLESIKSYADFSSKFWAAILAILILYISIN